MNRRVILSALIVLAIGCGYHFWPWFVVYQLNFTESHGEEASRQQCDRIVAAGERAIPAIIASIEAHSTPLMRAIRA